MAFSCQRVCYVSAEGQVQQARGCFGVCPTVHIWISSASWTGCSWHVAESYIMKKILLGIWIFVYISSLHFESFSDYCQQWERWPPHASKSLVHISLSGYTAHSQITDLNYTMFHVQSWGNNIFHLVVFNDKQVWL